VAVAAAAAPAAAPVLVAAAAPAAAPVLVAAPDASSAATVQVVEPEVATAEVVDAPPPQDMRWEGREGGRDGRGSCAPRRARARNDGHTHRHPLSPPSSLPLGYYEWAGLYLKRTNDGRAYVHYNQDGISKPADAVAVSESVGFGMLASVIAGPKSDFDALLKMYESFRNDRSGMMGWQIVDRGGVLKFNDDKFA
jgi:hypothetical protein